MKALLGILIPVLFLSFSGCVSVRDDGKALGKAGQLATQAIIEQTDSSRRTVNALPEWWNVRGVLVCSSIQKEDLKKYCVDEAIKSKPGTLSEQLKLLSDVMNKRIVAEQAVYDAYQSFANLAEYDAGAETEQAIKGAVGAINELTAAAAKIAPSPQTAGASAISSTFTTVASGIGNIIASERQNKLILSANLDLLRANEAMIAALTIEKNATEQFLMTLGSEADTLFSAFVQSGLVSPNNALAPLLAQIAPGIEMVETPPKENIALIKVAAHISIAERSKRKQKATVESYEAALATLKALSLEHKKLKEKQQIALDSIVAHVKRIQDLLDQIKQKK
ncbi:hypothetical protein Nit79A3_3107 [Nitrosomonas sp. Is79A3]|uniref:hypothetical protein n=1 Tax=Nitrosomonas sp. (strain Is79A3) TaxID=261292 RepID=UPI000215CBC7